MLTRSALPVHALSRQARRWVGCSEHAAFQRCPHLASPRRPPILLDSWRQPQARCTEQPSPSLQSCVTAPSAILSCKCSKLPATQECACKQRVMSTLVVHQAV